jgi:hypothetical protein
VEKGDQRVKPSEGEAGEYVPGEIFVKFKDDTETETVREISSRLQLKAVRVITGETLYLMTINDGVSVETVIKRLREYPEVEHSEPNYVVEMQ